MKKLFPLIVIIASIFVFSSAERYEKRSVIKVSQHMKSANRVIVAIESGTITELAIRFQFFKKDPNSRGSSELYLAPGAYRIGTLSQSGQQNVTTKVGAGTSQLGLEIENSMDFAVIEIFSADGNTIQGGQIYTVGVQ